MVEFFAENGATIIVGTILFALILAVILKMRRDKKNGKSSCGCDCGSCGCGCGGAAPKKDDKK